MLFESLDAGSVEDAPDSSPEAPPGSSPEASPPAPAFCSRLGCLCVLCVPGVRVSVCGPPVGSPLKDRIQVQQEKIIRENRFQGGRKSALSGCNSHFHMYLVRVHSIARPVSRVKKKCVLDASNGPV